MDIYIEVRLGQERQVGPLHRFNQHVALRLGELLTRSITESR